MALGYLTLLWIYPSLRNTGKLLPFTLSLSQTYTDLVLKASPRQLLFILHHFFPFLHTVCPLIMATYLLHSFCDLQGSVITPNNLLC